MIYLLKLVYSTNDGSRYIVGEVCDAIVDSENAKKRDRVSTQSHRVKERNSCHSLLRVNIHEPIKVLLEYTIALISVCFENSIETRFGSVSLPTSIKESDESITNLGNLVAMEEYM